MKLSTENKIQNLLNVLEELKAYSETMIEIIKDDNNDSDQLLVRFANVHSGIVRKFVKLYLNFENLITQLGLEEYNLQFIKYGAYIDTLKLDETCVNSISNDNFEKIRALLHFTNMLNLDTKLFLKSMNFENDDKPCFSDLDFFDPHNNKYLRLSIYALANFEQALEKLGMDYQKFKNMTKR